MQGKIFQMRLRLGAFRRGLARYSVRVLNSKAVDTDASPHHPRGDAKGDPRKNPDAAHSDKSTPPSLLAIEDGTGEGKKDL